MCLARYQSKQTFTLSLEADETNVPFQQQKLSTTSQLSGTAETHPFFPHSISSLTRIPWSVHKSSVLLLQRKTISVFCYVIQQVN